MDPQIWIGIAAVFVSGGAIGTAGTLLTQWIVRGLGEPPTRRDLADGREMARLRSEMTALVRKVHNMDERLDFQEQLLGGASPTRSPPRRLAEPDVAVEDDEGDGPGHDGGDGPEAGS